jgi:hypothetical protein
MVFIVCNYFFTQNKCLLIFENLKKDSSIKQESLITDHHANPTSPAQTAQLPAALENLSSALQAVQELIKLNSANLTSESSSSQSAQLTVNLANQLNNLSSKILSRATPTTSKLANSPQNKDPDALRHKGKPITPLKRQQLEAPSYTPTPINELKRIKEEKCEPDVEIIEIDKSDYDLDTKKRKTSHDDETIDTNETKHEEIDLVVDEELNSLKKFKNLLEPTSSTVSLSSTKNASSISLSSLSSKTSSSGSTKFDVVSFSKMNVKQQVMKRYEMLKRTPPTAEELRDARLKKQQTNLTGLVKNNYTPNSSSSDSSSILNKSTPVTSATFIPKLLLDSNDSSSKCPVSMRQRHLQMIFDNLKPLYLNTANDMAKALLRASQEEKSAYDRAKSKTIYVNLMANVVKKIRTEVAESGGGYTPTGTDISATRLVNNPNKLINVAPKPQPMVISHEAMLGGAKASKVSYSINRVKAVEVKDLNRELLPNFITGEHL